MRNKRAGAISLLGAIVIWATLLCCYLASWQDISAHELCFYWPAWDTWREVCENCSRGYLLESNGIIVQLFYRLLWDRLFSGLSLLGLRLPSIIAHCGSLVLAYLIGKEVSGRRAGILGAFLLATHFLQVSIAVHCRFFSASTFFNLLCLWLLIRICRVPTPRLWTCYIIAWAGALCSMVLNLLFVPCHIILYLACATQGKAKYCHACLFGLFCAGVFGALYLRDLGAVARFYYPYSASTAHNIGFPLLTHGCSGNKTLLFSYLGMNHGFDTQLMWFAYATAALLVYSLVSGLVATWRQRRCHITLFIPFMIVVFSVEWLTITFTIKSLTVVTNTVALWPLTCLAIAQVIGGRGEAARVSRVLYLILLTITAPIFCSNTFIHDRVTPHIAHVFQYYYRPSDIAIIHDHEEINPYWISGVSIRSDKNNGANELRTATHFVQEIVQGKPLRQHKINATSPNLNSLCALIYQNCPRGQRIWMVAHCGDDEATRLHDYLKWYTGRDIKYLTKSTEGAFVMYFVK